MCMCIYTERVSDIDNYNNVLYIYNFKYMPIHINTGSLFPPMNVSDTNADF